MDFESKIFLIYGPTASGKSDFAIKLAKKVNGEIINADSMQIYKELKILSARPFKKDYKNIKHHLYGIKSVKQNFSTGEWIKLADKKIFNIKKRGKIPILVGGTGLYYKSLVDGLVNIPEIPLRDREKVRKLHRELGSVKFYNRLIKIDPLVKKASNLKELLDENFKGSLEKMWKHIFERGQNNRFTIYLDSNDYLRLQCIFWKSIFSKLDVKSAYKLYEFHIQDLKVKSLLKVGSIHKSVREYLDQVEIAGREEFTEYWNQAEHSQFLKSLDPKSLSFENLFSSFFLEKNEKVREAFQKKLKTICWKLIVEEIQILKADVVKGIYDYIQVDLEKKESVTNGQYEISDVVNLIQANPQYLWLLDEGIRSDNIEHILNCYNANDFIRFMRHKNIIHQMPLIDHKSDDLSSKILKLAFEENYREILEIDIDSGFGSLFFAGSDSLKTNDLFLSYLYQLKRENNITALSLYEVC